MTDQPASFVGVVLDAPDPRALAAFYRDLLGWGITYDDETWVKLRSPDGSAGLSFQLEPLHRRPVWPSTTDDQQMQFHLDILVDDLEAASRRAQELGATVAEFQPQEGVRVHQDPVGHPFCLFVEGA